MDSATAAILIRPAEKLFPLLREKMEQKAKMLNLSDEGIFTGVRLDVPRLMLGAMDVFSFTSRYEGLGLVLVEAQAAGLPVVMSDVVSDEVIVVPGLIKTPSLRNDLTVWVRFKLDNIGHRRLLDESQTLIRSSVFHVIHSVTELCRLYFSQSRKDQR